MTSLCETPRFVAGKAPCKNTTGERNPRREILEVELRRQREDRFEERVGRDEARVVRVARHPRGFAPGRGCRQRQGAVLEELQVFLDVDNLEEGAGECSG